MSHSTALGCQKAPTRFLPSGRLTPVFPPMAASTWAEQRGGHVHVGDAPVVAGGGEAGQVGDHASADGRRPRRDAVSPSGRSRGTAARPRRATWPLRRRGPRCTSKGKPGSTVEPIPAWVTTTARAAPGHARRTRRRRAVVPDAFADDHVVAPLAELDRDRRSPLPSGRLRRAASITRSTTSSGCELVDVHHRVRDRA